MSVFFSDIRDVLSPYLVSASIRDSSSVIRRVRLASRETVSPETLYFGHAASFDPKIPYENVVLVGTGSAADALAESGDCNLVVIAPTDSWSEIFNKIEDRIEAGQDAFYQEVLAAERVGDILEVGARYLKRPLHLFDGALHSIKSHTGAGDADKYTAADLSAAMAANLKGNSTMAVQDTFAVAVHSETYQCFKLFLEDQVVAFLAILGENARDMDQTVVKMLFFALSRKLMESRVKPRVKDDLMHKLVVCLANNRRMRPREIALFLQRAGWGRDDSYYLLKVVDRDHDSDRLPQNIDLLVKEMSARISMRHHVYQEALYIIVNCTKSGLMRRAAFEAMFKDIMAGCRATAGFTNICKGFDYLFTCGFQTDIALHFGKLINPDYATQPYSFYFHYEMIHMMSAYADMSKYVHPMIRLLDEYDRANNSDLVMTVYAYLNDDRKIQKAANYLNIHKNSMAYRLEKILALTDFDLNDEFRTTHLRISCSIVKLQRIYRQKHTSVDDGTQEPDA